MPYKDQEAQRAYWRRRYQQKREERRAYDKRYYRSHADHIKRRTRKWSLENPAKMSKYRTHWADTHHLQVRDSRLRHNYGISLEQYDGMLIAQNGLCAICHRPESAMWKGRVRDLAVDHDHRTGKVRALLCMHCNRAIGCFDDNIGIARNAVTYLERYADNIET